ncbi:MAG TPA: hypothetical protein VHS28_02855 [Chloroflexota bacterium]|nr:hypothetical protein [Chloroflexota bacterium]
MMLTRLLHIVANARGIVTMPDMARELRVSRGLLEAMIADAVRLGYLSPVEGSCSHIPCSDCLLESSCKTTSSPGYWLLTDKGKRLLTRD